MGKIRNQEGFTLIEIIISIAIFGILVIGFLSVFSNSNITIFNMGNKSKAVAIAQDLIDTKNYSSLKEYSDYTAMMSTPFDPAAETAYVGRYCIREDALTIPAFGTLPAAESYNTITVLIFYGNNKDYVTLTAMTKLS
jgi:prepilin-type N-terminal cleavage/methylation domain-containing protein